MSQSSPEPSKNPSESEAEQTASEEEAAASQRKTLENLQRARDELARANSELGVGSGPFEVPRHNPFSRATASLKKRAAELASTPRPTLATPPPMGSVRGVEPEDPPGVSPATEHTPA